LNIIYPVLLVVPENAKNLKGREKVMFLSQHARKALKISAEHIGIEFFSLLKDDNGIPLPFQGTFWSVTHKPLYVGGIVAPAKIGIDIEQIKPISKGLFEKTAHDSEWNLSPDPRSLELFFRFWTAKEAVLKATGDGISGLLKCKVIEIPDNTNMVLHYQDRRWSIEHHFFNGHIAAVVKNEFDIKWIFDFSPIFVKNLSENR
jgi:4'-phosphopantetheinyl transferase